MCTCAADQLWPCCEWVKTGLKAYVINYACFRSACVYVYVRRGRFYMCVCVFTLVHVCVCFCVHLYNTSYSFSQVLFWTHSDLCVSAVHSCGNCVGEKKTNLQKPGARCLWWWTDISAEAQVCGMCVCVCSLNYFKKTNSWADILVSKCERPPLCTHVSLCNLKMV